MKGGSSVKFYINGVFGEKGCLLKGELFPSRNSLLLRGSDYLLVLANEYFSLNSAIFHGEDS